MRIFQDALLLAALTYINDTDFGYCLEFHEDEAIEVALGDFLNANSQQGPLFFTSKLLTDIPNPEDIPAIAFEDSCAY